MELLQIRWVLSLVETVIIIFLFAMPFAALLTYFERKWSALIQDRVGPSRANIGKLKFKGIFHVIADAIKLMFKEDSVTQNTNKFLFSAAPFFSFIAVFAVFALIPIAAPKIFICQVTDVNVGMLALFAFIHWESTAQFSVVGLLIISMDTRLCACFSYKWFLTFFAVF